MKFLVATLFLSGVLSAPFTSHLNTLNPPKCDQDSSRFHSKKTLLYSYEGETISGLVGTSDVRSGLKLRAQFQISPVQPCVFTLKVTEAELLETQSKTTNSLVYRISSGSSELRRELLARELFFESHAGVISDIRPEVGESAEVVNMKRGILSALQLKLINKDDTVKEVDINGECKANYRIKSRHPSGKVKSIVKTKNLSLCSDRSETTLGIPVTPYPTDKPFSLLNSNSMCKFTLSPRSRLGRAFCQETHLFRPFSSGYNSSSGAMTTVRQNLTLVGYSLAVHVGNSLSDREKSSLKYQHSRNTEKVTKSDVEVRTILEKLVAEDNVKPDSARLFSKLIFAFRRLNMKALTAIWYRYYECQESGRCSKEQAEKYQKFIVDALPHCGTLDCAQFMVNTISDKKVGTQQSVAFLTGIALVGKPSEDMVGNILYFCQETPSRTAFLTLGTLIHKYCQQHNCDNLNTRSSIYQADQFLLSKLRQNCGSSSPEDIDSITLALKAIGNAGRPLSAVSNLLKCAVHSGSTVINIEALQALRRVPCSTEMTQGLLNIYKSLSTDTEIRIEAYLALMRCPSETVIRKVADILDIEENNQVGSFVWSHLTNALESTEPVYGIPLRDIISKALGGRKLRSFNLDHLRFSHAYETSYYNKKNEVGGSSQGQIVFHPDSYFPRSAKFNLTIDVLGASINLLETAARFDGFETLVEQIFGSEGYFPDERLIKLLKIEPTDMASNLRSPRSVKEEEMDEIKNNLERLQDKMKIERKTPTGSLSFKVFGHELQFLSFDDIDWLQGEADSINVIDTLINIARGGKVTYTKSFMFLEADYEVPTALGFPLKLAVNGSAVSSVDLKGKFDIRNMFWGKKKFDVRGFVTPSAVVEISGKISVNAKHASSGIHVNTSLYTSTEINGNATYKEGEWIKLSIDPPTKPIYIVNVTSNLATFLNKKTEKISGSSRRVERQSCANFSRIFGVSLCGSISVPMAFRDYNAPYFPLSGESAFGLTFQTTNADLARFELEGRKLTSNDDNRYDWIFNMHIPGLTFGKRLEANSTFQFLNEGKYLSVTSGIHGYKFGKFEAKYNNITNGFHTKFSTPELAYLQPITIESEVFNQTNPGTNEQDIGLSINATYKKLTIQEVVTLFRHNDQYGFKSNLTYWPRKHVTTEGRISLVKKSLYLKMGDTNSKTKLFFAGKLGQSTNKFYVKVGNDIMKSEVKLNGEVNLKQRKILLDMFTKPSGNLMKFEAYPSGNAVDNGFYVRLLHANSSSQMTGYLGSSNTDTEATLKFNGTAMKQPFYIHLTRFLRNHERGVELVAAGFGNTANSSLSIISMSSSIGLKYFASLNDKTLSSKVAVFKHPREMGLKLHAALLGKTAGVQVAYFHNGQNHGLHLKLTGADKTVDTIATYFTRDEEKGLNFTVRGMDRSANMIWAYYTGKVETGLKMSASIQDKSVEIAAGLFRYDNERGLRVKANVLEREMEARWSILSGSRFGVKFAANAMKKNIELKSTFFNKKHLKEWRVDTVYGGKTTSLVSTYITLPSEKSLCSEVTDSKTVHFRVCTKLLKYTDENALQLDVEALGRKAEVRASLIHTATEKGGQLRMMYNDALFSDVFVGVGTTPSSTGLRIRGNIKEKSFDALLTYKNTHLKRAVDLQLRVLGNQVSFETVLVREQSLQGVQVNAVYQNQPAGSAYILISRKLASKFLKIGLRTAHKNGIYYKLSTTTSRIEKMLASMMFVRVNQKHYKYGWSVHYGNKGTSQEPSYLVTTKLHYARNKALTSIYQMINTYQMFNLLSKVELAPGQFLVNKFTYSKPSRNVFVQYELLPGIGITYNAAFVNTDQHLSLKSTMTILDYALKDSIALDRETGQLKIKFMYCPAFPPIEITSHLRVKNGVNMGFALTASNMTWNPTLLMDYSSKQMKLTFDVLPKVPIHMFAKIFDHKQFLLNLTTSAFSVQLAGERSTKDEYMLILKHQYLQNVFEDFKLTINSLYDLHKLQLKWDTKMAVEFLRRTNMSMRKLLNGTVTVLLKMSDTATKMATNGVNYMQSSGRNTLLRMMDSFETQMNMIKELLKGVKLNELIKKYSTSVTEMIKKIKGNLFKMVDEVKRYGTPLLGTFDELQKTVKEMAIELSPHLRSLSSDVRSWLSRSVNRYAAISICGRTVQEMAKEIMEKTRVFSKLFADRCMKQATLLVSKMNEMKIVTKELLHHVKKLKMTLDEFTCNYDIKCTSSKVQNKLKELINFVPRIENWLKQLNRRFEKISEQLIEQYKTGERFVSTMVEDMELRQKAKELLKPITDFLKTIILSIERKMIPLHDKVREMANKLKNSGEVYFDEMKLKSDEIVRTVEKVSKFVARHLTIAKDKLLDKIQETKASFEIIQTKGLEMCKKLMEKMQELKTMSWEEIHVFVKDGITMNYKNLRQQCELLSRNVVVKVEEILKGHATEFEKVKKIGKEIYAVSADAMNGRVTLKQARDKLSLLVHKILKVLQEQGKEALDKIRALKFIEHVMKAKTATINFYKETKHDLVKRATALYPKVMTELKNIVEKVKIIVKEYVELAKLRIDNLRQKQIVHLDKIVRKVKEIKLEIVHKAYELADHYKKLGSEQLNKKMMELKSLIKVYETMLKEAAHNYKNILTTFTAKQYQKIREEVLDMATLYQDMPMEDILKELRKKMSVEVNKVLGTVIEGVLSIYQRAFTYAKQTKMLYQDNFHLLAAKWNTISNIAREMNVKYQAMAKKQFQDVCRYYSEDIEPLINVYLAKIEIICIHALSYSKARYDLVKLWYEKVKHMKFKEFYFKPKELLQEWTKEWKKYQESYEVKVNEWKGKINHFIEEVKEESKKVVSRVKKANEAVQQDAITTFSPYEPLLKNILQKHKGLSTLKLAALRNNYKELFELITDNRKTAEIYMNMFQKKLTVPDFDRKEIASNILKYLNGYPLLADAMESIESIKDGRLMTQVMQSLNKCPFIADVRNHELWRVLKQEFFNHELVIASQELGKSSFNKLRELCSEFYAHSISILRELGRQIATKATGMKEDLLARNDLVKNQLKQTHSELKIKLRYVRDQFKSKGEKFLHRSLDVYNSGQKTIVTNIENLGEMSLYDVQIRATKCFENLLAPLKSTYNDVSDFVEKQLQILAEQQNAIKERAARLRKRVMIIVADSKTWLNNMYKKSTEWTVTTWTNRKSDIADLVKFAQKFGDDFEKLTASTLFTCKELVHEYIAYKDFLRMTPNQLIQRVKEMPTKSCEAARRITESLKSAIVDRLRLFLRATMNFIGSINSNTLRQAQIQTEVGVQMTRSVLEDTVKQLHFIVTEILETALFFNKFYVEDTLYSRRPEFLDHVDYQIRLLVNCTQICKATTMRVFNKTSKMLAEIFHYGVSNIGDLFRNRLPEFIKYLREVKAEMDTQTIQELTNKVKTLQKQYHRLTVEYIKSIYAKTISMLNGSYQKLENYLKLSKSQAISRFNLAKDNAIDFLKTDVREVVSQAYRMILPTSNNIKAFCQKQCTEIMVLLEKLNEKYPFITKHINAVRIADLPVMLKKARGKLPLLWNTMTKDLTTLVNDAVENLIRIASSVRVHVTMLEKYTYLKFNHYGESMEKMINQLHKTTKDVVHVIRINAKDNLPRVIRYIRVGLPVIFIQTVGNVTKYAVQTIQQIEIAIDSGELNLTLPRLDALYEIGTGMKNSFDKHCIDAAQLVRKTITEVYPRITVFYQDTLKKSNEILGQLKEGALTNCKKVKQDVITFYKLKLTSLRQLTERFLTSMRTSLKKNLDDMREVTVQTLKTCETMTTIYYKKAEDIFEAAYEVDIGQTIANYTRMLSERKNKFVNIMKSSVTEMVNKLVVGIQKMRTQAIEMNDKIMETVKHGKISMEKQLLNYYKSTKINHYVDIEDLMNKTIEISEDVINLSLIQDALRIGSMCYRESKRLFDQIIESSEFALYIAKHAVKHNDLWGIVQELTNPFHWVPPSNSIAMIFGRPHVFTFDGQYYKFPGYKKPSCTYVLAHDFRDKNFTLMSQETSLILATKSGYIKIHADGKVEATVNKDTDGKDVKIVHNELPVEMMHVTVKREGSFVKISHDQGLDVTCDIKHFFCTFNVHRFYHGKLAGLLGTNNNERYDEFMKPDRTIAKSMIDFANAWEVSGDTQCKVKDITELKKKSCSKPASPRCKELFSDTSSPLAKHFKTLNPEPFYKACVFDTSDCQADTGTESYCNVTAAYTALLREKGVWARQISECASCGSKAMWQKWTQPGNKNVDVVLLVPETLNISSFATNLPGLLQELQTDLSKYQPRYAVVGFGGKSGVHQNPHVVTSGGKIFGRIEDVAKAIQNMKFTSEKADALDAIQFVARLPFNPGSSKVVILLTDQNRQALSSIPITKAIKDLSLHGIIFNVIGPYFEMKQHRNVLGLWKDQAYLRRERRQLKLHSIALPSDDYIRLAESSQGGIFNLRVYSKSVGQWTKLLKRAMKTTLTKQIDNDQTYCRQCVCVPTLGTEPVSICRINRHARCS